MEFQSRTNDLLEQSQQQAEELQAHEQTLRQAYRELEKILESPGLNIIRANSGNEALGLVLEYDIALVLMDVQMPEMNGFETAELIRGNSQTRHIPIIFVTAISKEREYVFKGYEAGAVDYLFKPLNTDILQNKVNIFPPKQFN